MNFNQQVAIITGAGSGLGRSHAISLAKRGAKIVVNDLGKKGKPSVAAESVAQEITRCGGEVMTNGADVSSYTDVELMIEEVMGAWGRIDILINNAGVLRDKSFTKMDINDFKFVIDVHLMGTVNCTKAVWGIMKKQNYGRVVMTTSSSGLYGNFGQTNYGAAKMAVVGLMNSLDLEGKKYGIKVNCLAPTASTAMTQDILSDDALSIFDVQSVSDAALFLAHESAPARQILCAGGGCYSLAKIIETKGICLSPDEQSAESVAHNWEILSDKANHFEFTSGLDQSSRFLNLSKRNVK